MDKDSHTSLSGKLLLAMPNMGDPRFHRAVILICAHDKNGAMGLVINHMLPGVDMKALLTQLKIPVTDERAGPLRELAVMGGGPVENGRGFILHGKDFHQNDTISISDEISVTGTIDALRAVAQGKGPEQMIFVLGYSGWEAGQLEQEIQENAWLVSEPDFGLIFETTPADRWIMGIKNMGVDLAMLSLAAGQA